jgi:hypothetical protein
VSVRAAASVPKPTTSLDTAKRISGRQHWLAVDVLGLWVAASVHDNAIGTALLNRTAATTPVPRRTALVGEGFKTSVVDDGCTLGVDVQIDDRTRPAPATSPNRSAGAWNRPVA